MTRRRATSSLRDITPFVLAGLLACDLGCSPKDDGTTGDPGASESGTASTGSTGPQPATTSGPDPCASSCGSSNDCVVGDPMTCPEGQVCVAYSECGCSGTRCAPEP